MAYRNLGRHASLLDDDSVDTPVEGEGETPVEEEVSAPIVEATEETAEVEAADAGADEAAEAHENIEEIQEAVSEQAANGGMSQESAVFAHLALKAAMGRYDYNRFIQTNKIPSMESFSGGSSSRQRYTQITLEGVGTALRAFWDAIVRQVKKMWAAVKNWYLKVLDAAPRMKKRAEALAKKSSDITGAAEEKSFDLGTMHQLHIGGKAPSPSEAITVMKALEKSAVAYLGNETSGQYENVFEDFETVVESFAEIDDKVFTNAKITRPMDLYDRTGKIVDAGKGTEGAKKLIGALDKLVESLEKHQDVGSVPDGGAKRFGDDVTAKCGRELFGGRAIVTTKPIVGKSDTLVRFVRGSGIRFIDFKEKAKDVDSSGSFKTLASSDIRSLMDELADICDHIMTYKKAWEARDKQFGKMDNAAKKAINAVEKDKDASPMKTRIVKDVALGMSSLYQMGIRFENSLIQYLLKVGSALITWVERSLSQYKGV